MLSMIVEKAARLAHTAYEWEQQREEPGRKAMQLRRLATLDRVLGQLHRVLNGESVDVTDDDITELVDPGEGTEGGETLSHPREQVALTLAHAYQKGKEIHRRLVSENRDDLASDLNEVLTLIAAATTKAGR
jgi:hypothetical protein